MEETTGGVPDWSALPTDVLDSVLSVLEISDFLTAGAVCRSWKQRFHAAPRLGLFSRRTQEPCLLYFSIGLGPDVTTLHRLSTAGRSYHLALSPEEDDATVAFVRPPPRHRLLARLARRRGRPPHDTGAPPREPGHTPPVPPGSTHIRAVVSPFGPRGRELDLSAGDPGPLGLHGLHQVHRASAVG